MLVVGGGGGGGLFRSLRCRRALVGVVKELEKEGSVCMQG